MSTVKIPSLHPDTLSISKTIGFKRNVILYIACPVLDTGDCIESTAMEGNTDISNSASLQLDTGPSLLRLLRPRHLYSCTSSMAGMTSIVYGEGEGYIS